MSRRGAETGEALTEINEPSREDAVRARVREAIAKAWGLRPGRGVPCGRSWGLGRQDVIKVIETEFGITGGVAPRAAVNGGNGGRS